MNGGENMKYFTKKSNMEEELKKVYNDNYEYNIDIRKENISIDGKIYKLWSMDSRPLSYSGGDVLSQKEIDSLLSALSEGDFSD